MEKSLAINRISYGLIVVALPLIVAGFLFPVNTASLMPTAIPENRHGTENMENDTLFVHEFVLARDIVERNPVDVVTSFTMDDARAWCFASIHNSEKMQDVYFEWYHEGELYFRMNAKVGISENWRTYSSVGLQPGTWRVVLRNRHETILAERSFEVTG